MFHLDLFNDLQQSVKIGIKQNMYIIHTPVWYEEKTKTEYTIWSIARGNVYIQIEKKEYCASEGDVILFSPGIRYTAHSDENGCEFLFQQFSLELGNSINLLAELNSSGILRSKYIGELCLDFCRKEKQKGEFVIANSITVYADFFSYITKVIALIDEKKNEPFFEKSVRCHHSDFWKAVTYISEHFPENLSIKEIAVKVGFSEKYFIQRFKQTFGMPPKQYLIQCRMRYAVHMILHSEQKIQDIAMYLGYADIYSFSKAFKKYYGEAPSDFRRFHKT